MGLAVLGLVAWLALGSVERAFSAECALALAGERHSIISGVTGGVVEVLANEGDPVEAGTPIARVRQRDLDHEVSVARSRVELIEQHASEGDEAFLDVLSTARAELLDLEARRELGGYIVSPYAGEITEQNLVLEQQVNKGTEVAMVRSRMERRFEAITLVSEDDAQRLAVRMESQVIYPSRNGRGSNVLEAEVAHISPHPVLSGGWLDSLGLEVPAAGGHLLRLVMTESPPPTAVDGDTCRLRVILSHEPPWSLLRAPSATDMNR